MLNSVAVIALEDVAAFELGVLAEVFGTDRTEDGLPAHDFTVCTVDGGPVRTRSGFGLSPHADLGPVAHADLVAVPAHLVDTHVPTAVLDALRRAVDRGAYVLSVCSGAFILGQAGLLDDRVCTTHWRHVDELQRLHPRAKVQCNSLYVADGPVLTSAGTAAGIDACLHLVRQEYGSATATRLARRMVVPPHRDGGQAQYVEAPIPATPDAATLEPVLEWLMGHLDRPITVDAMAERAGMSPRTFARRFRAETGTTAHDWLTNQRVLLARRLLEETRLSVEQVAGRAGFGDAAALRHHFVRRVGATPHSYRSTFRDRGQPPLAAPPGLDTLSAS
ncbi:GlxA family transcriptional regulator [Micromonospora yangpuensis]|uniref:Transcriptional regulator, AraC family with amidase-like domain n=1 Tax=Micromonospora yangpuensis TaxID=683228 RepID=A0A1C6VF53_9ACTN|nr:helix-turn-helix domain-containing protein [Micromonospora yangpuensis]GGM29981.1 AraC family transcriptional regulator [Micromonospora yangpuensis]SCL64966.1 transcriptional regulator, AraC family with amidase-like domain [Micromonospora yangpuensis]